MYAIRVEVTQWLDDYQPGFVECRFRDARGVEHVFTEKVPVITEVDLRADSEYPQPGSIACKVQKIYRDDEGRIVAKVSTEKPSGIESIDGVADFEVLMDELVEDDWDLPAEYRDSDDSTLPTERQREKLCEIMAFAFIEMRALGWSDKAAQIADLADAFHNLPREMYGWGSWSWKRMRRWLLAYQEKCAESRGGFNYAAQLDAIRESLPDDP